MDLFSFIQVHFIQPWSLGQALIQLPQALLQGFLDDGRLPFLMFMNECTSTTFYLLLNVVCMDKFFFIHIIHVTLVFKRGPSIHGGI